MFAKKKMSQVTIISKRLVPRMQTGARGWYTSYGFVIVQFDDGEQREFEVPKKEIYELLLINYTGILTFKRYNVLDFERNFDL